MKRFGLETFWFIHSLYGLLENWSLRRGDVVTVGGSILPAYFRAKWSFVGYCLYTIQREFL